MAGNISREGEENRPLSGRVAIGAVVAAVGAIAENHRIAHVPGRATRSIPEESQENPVCAPVTWRAGRQTHRTPCLYLYVIV